MNLSKSVLYGIAALLELADHRSEAPLCAAAIASRTGMPSRYLMEIMKSMRDAGLVTSTRGSGGGYKLSRPLSRISVYHIYEAIAGHHPQEQLPTDAFAASSQRLIDNTLQDAADYMRRRLSMIALDSLKLNK